MKQVITAILIIILISSLITITFTLNQITNEQERLESDLQYRSLQLANSLKESAEPNFINKSDLYLQNLVERFADNKRLAGLAIVDNTGTIIAVTSTLPKEISGVKLLASDVMDSDKEKGEFVDFENNKMFLFATPFHDNKSVVGSLIIVQNANYIESRFVEIWKNNLLRMFFQISLLAMIVIAIFRWLIYVPILSLAETLKQARTGSLEPTKLTVSSLFFKPLTNEISNIKRSLFEARLAANEEAKATLEKLDSPWTAERLKHFIIDLIKDRKLIVVSNREPYIHTKNGNKIEYFSPASGMVTALEPIMQATGGTWIAHGSGDADKLVVDKNDSILVPPNNPKYKLKRIWLSKEEEDGYYVGFSNECLWPLTHTAHVRPIFRQEDWEQYKKVNIKFAQTILREIHKLKRPIILIQDFHLALVPNLIKQARPDAVIGIFWHEPWVSPESFSIFPWKKVFLEGMLGADLLGFHTQLHCNNFIETVGRELESLIDYEHFTITKGGHLSQVKPFPISIAFANGNVTQMQIEEDKKNAQDTLIKLGINSKFIGIGVERLDYIKGILERLKAIEVFLRRYPQYKEKFTFIQIAAPSRDKVKKYQEFSQEVEREVQRINSLYQTSTWKPVVLLKKHHSHQELDLYYKSANICLVTSLHDGMNLVSKEFIASRNDEKGVLLISQFTGASRELKDGILVNPYNADTTADAIKMGLEMSVKEQTKRMKKLRSVVKNYNIYRWSAEFLKTLIELE